MKRRSFIGLVLACLGVKLASKKVTFQTPTYEFLESANPPVYLSEIMVQDIYDVTYHEWPKTPPITDVRMNEAGDKCRQWLSDRLWYQTRKTSFDELE